jgi:hypothetical protein
MCLSRVTFFPFGIISWFVNITQRSYNIYVSHIAFTDKLIAGTTKVLKEVFSVLASITGMQIQLLHTIAKQAYKILWPQWQKVFHLGATPIHPDIVHRYKVDPEESKDLYQFP